MNHKMKQNKLSDFTDEELELIITEAIRDWKNPKHQLSFFTHPMVAIGARLCDYYLYNLIGEDQLRIETIYNRLFPDMNDRI